MRFSSCLLLLASVPFVSVAYAQCENDDASLKTLEARAATSAELGKQVKSGRDAAQQAVRQRATELGWPDARYKGFMAELPNDPLYGKLEKQKLAALGKASAIRDQLKQRKPAPGALSALCKDHAQMQAHIEEAFDLARQQSVVLHTMAAKMK